MGREKSPKKKTLENRRGRNKQLEVAESVPWKFRLKLPNVQMIYISTKSYIKLGDTHVRKKYVLIVMVFFIFTILSSAPYTREILQKER